MNTKSLIQILVWLIVLALVIYASWLVIGMLGLPAEVKTIVLLVLSVIFLLMILGKFGILNGKDGC
jgi:hypothetical protein